MTRNLREEICDSNGVVQTQSTANEKCLTNPLIAAKIMLCLSDVRVGPGQDWRQSVQRRRELCLVSRRFHSTYSRISSVTSVTFHNPNSHPLEPERKISSFRPTSMLSFGRTFLHLHRLSLTYQEMGPKFGGIVEHLIARCSDSLRSLRIPQVELAVHMPALRTLEITDIINYDTAMGMLELIPNPSQLRVLQLEFSRDELEFWINYNEYRYDEQDIQAVIRKFTNLKQVVGIPGFMMPGLIGSRYALEYLEVDPFQLHRHRAPCSFPKLRHLVIGKCGQSRVHRENHLKTILTDQFQSVQSLSVSFSHNSAQIHSGICNLEEERFDLSKLSRLRQLSVSLGKFWPLHLSECLNRMKSLNRLRISCKFPCREELMLKMPQLCRLELRIDQGIVSLSASDEVMAHLEEFRLSRHSDYEFDERRRVVVHNGNGNNPTPLIDDGPFASYDFGRSFAYHQTYPCITVHPRNGHPKTWNGFIRVSYESGLDSQCILVPITPMRSLKLVM